MATIPGLEFLPEAGILIGAVLILVGLPLAVLGARVRARAGPGCRGGAGGPAPDRGPPRDDRRVRDCILLHRQPDRDHHRGDRRAPPPGGGLTPRAARPLAAPSR